MRIAILSDIHGNSIALDAVLADLDRRGGADLRVDSDHGTVIAMFEALGHPGRAWLIAHQRGEVP